MRPASCLTGLAAFALSALAAADTAGAQQTMRKVDLELVLAVDVSRSMDEQEHALQRDGYVQAFRHNDVINALMSGPQGRIAVAYMEWAAETYPIIPWVIIDSKESALAFADKLASEPPYSERRTSISTALYDATRLIEQNDIVAPRRVIDVSGDGANNSGPPVEEARDFVLGRDIVINGLPIMLRTSGSGFGGGGGGDFGVGGFGGGFGPGFDTPHLDRYYKHCVIGGNGAFISPVFSLEQLAATIRKKLVLEIAGLDLGTDALPGTAPVEYGEAKPQETPAGPGIVRAQLKLPTEKTDCFSGEKQRGGRGGFGFDPPAGN